MKKIILILLLLPCAMKASDDRDPAYEAFTKSVDNILNKNLSAGRTVGQLEGLIELPTALNYSERYTIIKNSLGTLPVNELNPLTKEYISGANTIEDLESLYKILPATDDTLVNIHQKRLLLMQESEHNARIVRGGLGALLFLTVFTAAALTYKNWDTIKKKYQSLTKPASQDTENNENHE